MFKCKIRFWNDFSVTMLHLKYDRCTEVGNHGWNVLNPSSLRGSDLGQSLNQSISQSVSQSVNQSSLHISRRAALNFHFIQSFDVFYTMQPLPHRIHCKSFPRRSFEAKFEEIDRWFLEC